MKTPAALACRMLVAALLAASPALLGAEEPKKPERSRRPHPPRPAPAPRPSRS